MKKLLLAAGSLVALLVASPVQAADYQEVEAPWSWNGAYIGVAGAWLWDNGVDYKPAYVPDFHVEHDLSGVVAGGQVGARVQRDWFVGGVELQGFWADVSGNKDTIIDERYGLLVDSRTDVDALAMGKVKLGVALDRWWLFGLGGIAVADLNPAASVDLSALYWQDAGTIKLKWSDEKFAGGWVVGAGVNYAILDNLVIGVEWNRIDFGNVEFAAPVKLKGLGNIGSDLRVNSDFVFDTVQASISYNF